MIATGVCGTAMGTAEPLRPAQPVETIHASAIAGEPRPQLGKISRVAPVRDRTLPGRLSHDAHPLAV
jgi:hypothetical protein